MTSTCPTCKKAEVDTVEELKKLFEKTDYYIVKEI